MDIDARVRATRRGILTRLVRRLHGNGSLRVVEWRVERIAYHAANPVTAGLYRFAGIAHERGILVDWSLVLKVMRRPPAGSAAVVEDLESIDYWRRELLAYRSGMLDALPDGLLAPRCAGAWEHDEGWLWLEDVADAYPSGWTPAVYERVAGDLGRFGGAYLTGTPLPTYRWLSRGLLRRAARAHVIGGGGLEAFALWEGLLVRELFPRPVRDRLLRLWAERSRLLDALDRLPRTLCHFDATRHNLLVRRRPDDGEETVALDWAFVGAGPLGADMSLLLTSPFYRCELPIAAADELWERMIARYLDGLREAGWRGDTRVARFGIIAAAALRSAFISPPLTLIADPEAMANEARRWGVTSEEIAGQRAGLTYRLLDLADQALTMVDDLPHMGWG